MCDGQGDKKEVVYVNQAASTSAEPSKSVSFLILLIAVCGIVMTVELGALVNQSTKSSEVAPITINTGGASAPIETATIEGAVYTEDGSTTSDNVPDQVVSFTSGDNVCAGKKPKLPNVECIVDAITNVGPQSGANVTKGYKGGMEVDHVPITTPYWMNGMCPVNVHWHLGTEHLSVGEYDEEGTGPTEVEEVDGGVEYGYRCNKFDETDAKFTRDYDWKHCINMNVGETYEVHWPHSAAGACGTPNQFQTPFYDGVFCIDDVLTDTASQIGVQAQVFTIVNDESYYWPDLMRGMIVDGEMGEDIAKYTGSTTGSSRDNIVCSQYSPITWQVDRKCHLISASSFDKLCADMKTQRDDMTLDLFPHGSRELVKDELVANNQHGRHLRFY